MRISNIVAVEKKFVARVLGKVHADRGVGQSGTMRLNDILWSACKQMPQDYKPWGEVEKEDPAAPRGWWADCSSSCRHYLVLADVGAERVSLDWGVCTNPRSHRHGLLTFEHQGCPAFEYDEEEGGLLDAEVEQRKPNT